MLEFAYLKKMIFNLTISELKYLVRSYGLSGYLSKFRSEESITFFRLLNSVLDDCSDANDGSPSLASEDGFCRDISTYLDIECDEYFGALVEHSYEILTYVDILNSCGRYVPRLCGRNDDVSSDDGGMYEECCEHAKSTFNVAISSLRDYKKYNILNERFKPDFKIFSSKIHYSNDKDCWLDGSEFLKDEFITAEQSLIVQAEEIDYAKIKDDWKIYVVSRLIEEIAMSYVRFAKKELILSGCIGDYPHNEFFMHGECWGGAYLCMYNELIKPKITE